MRAKPIQTRRTRPAAPAARPAGPAEKRPHEARPATSRGFTLVELLIVIVIIAILAGIALGVIVGMTHNARVAQTVSVIERLDQALRDRLQQFNGTNVEPQPMDIALAGGDARRAHVIARLRLYKEWFPQYFDQAGNGDWSPIDIDGDGNPDQTEVSAVAQSYRALAAELSTDPASGQSLMGNHNPATSSSECLYLILLAGARSGGAVDPETFSPREVADTDGDGIPEFIDGWGNPILFFRRPYLYGNEFLPSEVQRGARAYANAQQQREYDPYDADRLLLVEPWWSNARPLFEGATSGGVQNLQAFFPLDEMPIDQQLGYALSWNNGSDPNLGATAHPFPGKPLVISAGPDEYYGLLETAVGGQPAVHPSALQVNDPGLGEVYGDNLSNHNRRTN